MNSKKWIIRYIEVIIDIVVLFGCYLIANWIKFGFFRTGLINHQEHYLTLFIMEFVSYIIVHIVAFADDDLIGRNLMEEIYSVCKMYVYVGAVTVGCIYFTKTAEYFSREQMLWTVGLGTVLTVICRQILKRIITKEYHRSGANQKIMLITTSDQVEKVIKKIKTTRNWDFRISNIAVIDKDMTGEVVDKIEVVANADNMIEVIATAEIDAVYVHLPSLYRFNYHDFIETIHDMGKTVHLNVNEYEVKSGEKHLDFLGKFAVVTWENKYYRVRHLLIKRMADIIFGMVGVAIAVPVTILAFLGELITFDRGPVIISLVRVGKNGRRFYYLKFRTMYMDTMHTPRYTPVGKVLKALNLENLPSAWNVFWGDMSMVGNPAPSLPEFIEYSVPHRKSLSMKPGIIGFWQAYSVKKGRLDEETQSEFDQEYILNWTVGLDVRIIFRVVCPFIKSQSRKLVTLSAQIQDEMKVLSQVVAEQIPLAYDKSVYEEKTGFGVMVYHAIKRMVDIVLSLLGIIVLLPVFIILALIIKLSDGGSIFYSHTRVGYRGKKVSIYKFRSMKTNAGELEKILTPEQLEQYVKEFKIDNDPRITKIGSFLRKTSLDELPQLFNILKGDLTLVGPRPIVEKETEIYGREIAKLLSVKPGLTGYWQAYARNNATYESGERQKMEMYYVEHCSLWLDLKIIIRTFFSVIKEEGAQ